MWRGSGEDLHAAADLSRAQILDIESHPVTSRGLRQRLSFSQLAYFLQCPVRYKFAQVYGLELPQPDPIDFGANVHRALLNIHERAQTGQIPSPQANPAQDRQAQKAAVRQLQQYVIHYGESLSRVAQAESGFSVGLDRHVLVGKIDLLRRADDGYELVDFKTGKSAPAALEQVDKQLDLYALGVEASLKLPLIRQNAHFLEDDKVYTRPWSSDRAILVKQRLSTLLDEIVRQEFLPRPAYCQRCSEFRAICPYPEDKP